MFLDPEFDASQEPLDNLKFENSVRLCFERQLQIRMNFDLVLGLAQSQKLFYLTSS